MHNVDIEAPRWIAGYELLANTLGDGFDMCIYEYTNDMSFVYWLLCVQLDAINSSNCDWTRAASTTWLTRLASAQCTHTSAEHRELPGESPVKRHNFSRDTGGLAPNGTHFSGSPLDSLGFSLGFRF